MRFRNAPFNELNLQMLSSASTRFILMDMKCLVHVGFINVLHTYLPTLRLPILRGFYCF